ncbi:O-antigen polysaccharide polymerase Wzy [Parabacteroides distasonis]|uniref:O-antigen polysaccharide polymerase Wzy n=1 Tax=Parabacteroides distasonis TaxID=823 RepID=UPI0035AC1728
MIFVLFFLVNQSEFIISALFLVWVNMTIYSVRDLKSKGMLFAFCVAFFSFLMGRHLLSYYFDYEVEAFSEDVNTHAELCMLLSLVTVFFLICSFMCVIRGKINRVMVDMFYLINI